MEHRIHGFAEACSRFLRERYASSAAKPKTPAKTNPTGATRPGYNRELRFLRNQVRSLHPTRQLGNSIGTGEWQRLTPVYQLNDRTLAIWNWSPES